MGIVVSIYAVGADHEIGLRELLAARSMASEPEAPPSGLWGAVKRLIGPAQQPSPLLDQTEALISDIQENSHWILSEEIPAANATLCVDVDKAWEMIAQALKALSRMGIVDAASTEMTCPRNDLPHADFAISVILPDEVQKIASGLRNVGVAELLSVMDQACKGAYIGDTVASEGAESYVDYVWGNFDDARWLYLCAARNNRTILVIQH